MKTKKYYFLLGLLLFIARLTINFSSDALSGINGAYNILQTRTILQTGQLGFPDMPLYFYLNAGIVKLVSLLSATDLEVLIVFVNKIIDSLSISLIVIPLYFIRKNILTQPIPLRYELSVLAFATLFFAPLSITGELQKNAAAIPLLATFIYFLLANFQQITTRRILLGALFFVLTALTHFGVFSVAFIVLLVSIFVKYKQKAILPVLAISALCLGLIFVFDASRALRLLKSGLMLVSELPRPSPFLAFSVVFIYPVLWFSYRLLQKQGEDLSPFFKNIIYTLGITLLVITFPFMKHDYAMRLGLISYVPLTVLLLAVGSFFIKKWQKIISVVLSLVVLGSVLFIFLIKPREATVSDAAFQDLEVISEQVSYSSQTLFVAKHGLEWWVAWKLKGKVSQPQAVDLETFEKYSLIYCVIDKTSEASEEHHHRGPRGFPEPYNPKDGHIVYESDYFRLVELKEKDFLAFEAYRLEHEKHH